MTDVDLISYSLKRGHEAREKVIALFSKLTPEQINWKPSPNAWSVGQCLDHLIVSDRCYFSDLEKITKGMYQKTFWQKVSPFSGLFGWMLKEGLKEEVKRKMKTSPIFYPSSSAIPGDIVERYVKNLETFMGLVSKITVMNGIVIASPVNPFITYSLRDAFTFLFQHEHRHINQAIRVTKAKGFPV